MEINILPIVSLLHNDVIITKETEKFLFELQKESGIKINVIDINEVKSKDNIYILVQSGGSEIIFKSLEHLLKEPYYLLTMGSNNSLAASIEIAAYLRNKGKFVELLHGSYSYISNRIHSQVNKGNKTYDKYGVLGKPSDWLISCDISYYKAKEKFDIDLVDLDINELIDGFNNSINSLTHQDKLSELEKASILYNVLKNIILTHDLKGITIRCFDLLDTIKVTACFALAKLNSEGYISCCEGDIPAFISMILIYKYLNISSFQANPSLIDVEKNEMIFAHCTVPFNMCSSYSYKTHFESNISIGVKGELKKSLITVFRIANNLNSYYLEEGVILENLNESNLCRTQIKVRLDNTKYFLTNPYGNHHIIFYGHFKDELGNILENLK